MNQRTFVRIITKLGRKRGVPVRFDPVRGKGSHGTLYYGAREAVVPHTLKQGTLRGILKRLGLSIEDLYGG